MVLRASGSLLVLVSFVALVMESTCPAEAAVVATGIAGFSLTGYHDEKSDNLRYLLCFNALEFATSEWIAASRKRLAMQQAFHFFLRVRHARAFKAKHK